MIPNVTELRVTLRSAPVTQVKITNEPTSERIENTHPCCETIFSSAAAV